MGIDQAPEIGHETRDASAATLAYFGMGLCLCLALILISVKWLFFHFERSQSLGPPATPFVNERPLPPGPRLQADPLRDWQIYRAQQQETLDSYAWVDQKNGVVRIPIDRAMDLLLQRGLPVRSEGTPRTAGSAGGAGAASGAQETH